MDATDELRRVGWRPDVEEAFEPFGRQGLVPARVAAADRSTVLLLGMGEPVAGQVAGRWRNEAFGAVGLPVVGDWVAVKTGDAVVVEALLARRSLFVRKEAGRGSVTQPIAANVDRVLVVTDVGADFSPRRIERYAAAALSGGARPAVVVNKADVPHDERSLRAQIEEVLPGHEAVFTSTVAEGGLDPLAPLLAPGTTVALVGSSGVGKSSLLNRLLGTERQATLEIRGDGTGRHATTRRELVVAPSGVLVIDTPGMREFGIVDADEGIALVFAEVEAVAGGCRFGDCTHHGEPGCRIAEGLAEGVLTPRRVQSWLALKDELALNERREAERRTNSKSRWKSIHKEGRRMRRLHGKLGLKDR